MTTAPPASRDVLTQLEAEARASRISDVSYELTLDLNAGAERYRGTNVIHFSDSGQGDTFIDLTGETIEFLSLNGEQINNPDWNGHRITLPGNLLKAENLLHITYENEYDHTGDGLHQFIDPEDNQEYLYSNFEPFSAHKLLPCFDQPDIKATYRLTVAAPSHWEVIHNSAATSKNQLGDGRIRHEFAETASFSPWKSVV